MKVPFLVLSYGDFTKGKKLFSIELDGVHTLPVFTDAATAQKYAQRMNQVLKGMKDPRKLQTQVCTDAKLAHEMFDTIIAYYPDLHRVIVDPSPPRDDEKFTDASEIKIIEDIRDIDDVMESLQANAGSDSKTP